ncbi:uncharacterized protein CIMG_11723 [Coccidioides immitis RS]|uniref:Uncharacterized protein n=1 Tax=Coccidioides immitis (strain RS) TaxID=246410 RepID=A0A0D8JTB8_COCIM|nr:uncharacterized protein CIMG_11723 [Coccidioides immitis RS]KJF60542.1 hypothetical protein CIMG_11723 [Coccidioides immitis RS]
MKKEDKGHWIHQIYPHRTGILQGLLKFLRSRKGSLANGEGTRFRFHLYFINTLLMRRPCLFQHPQVHIAQDLAETSLGSGTLQGLFYHPNRLARREALNVLGKISDHRSTGRDSAQSARHRSPSGPGPLQP